MRAKLFRNGRSQAVRRWVGMAIGA